ncbi:MAG: type II secretion system protein [Planctomycetota bacterium]
MTRAITRERQSGDGFVTRSRGRTSGVSGFSLIELLVVILIIALVVAIIVPALGGAREAARSASTNQLMTNVANAAESFNLDRQRAPGYFTPKQMGSSDNIGAYFSAMQNVMLELAGGIVGEGGGENAAENRFLVGPRASAEQNDLVLVDLDRIGVESDGNNVYFRPDESSFVSMHPDVQDVPNRQGVFASVRNEGNLRVPSLIDSFGTPLLAWQRDTSVTGQAFMPGASGIPNDAPLFARAASGRWDDRSGRFDAYFYWASNAAFLQATAVGQKSIDQAENSLYGSGIRPDDRERSLTAMLGHPGFPGVDLNASGLSSEDIAPSAPRAPLMIHSAGRDGVYLGLQDAGELLPSGQDYVWYSSNFFSPGTTSPGPEDRYTDNGQVVTEDVLDSFDDMITGVGQ